LLEVGELGHFHAVHPDFPAQAPGAERRVFPVVLDETHVVFLEVEAEGFERAEVKLEDVVRRGLQNHLILVVVLHAVRVLAVAAVLGAARGLHVGRFPGFGADRAQEGGGVAGAGTDFHVVGLQQGAALVAPVLLEAQDDFLKSRLAGFCGRLLPASGRDVGTKTCLLAGGHGRTRKDGKPRILLGFAPLRQCPPMAGATARGLLPSGLFARRIFRALPAAVQQVFPLENGVV